MSPTFLPSFCRMKRPQTIFLLLRSFGEYYGELIGIFSAFGWVLPFFLVWLYVVVLVYNRLLLPPWALACPGNLMFLRLDVTVSAPQLLGLGCEQMLDALEEILWRDVNTCWTSTQACAMQQMLSREMLMFKKFLEFVHMTDAKQHLCFNDSLPIFDFTINHLLRDTNSKGSLTTPVPWIALVDWLVAGVHAVHNWGELWRSFEVLRWNEFRHNSSIQLCHHHHYHHLHHHHHHHHYIIVTIYNIHEESNATIAFKSWRMKHLNQLSIPAWSPAMI